MGDGKVKHTLSQQQLILRQFREPSRVFPLFIGSKLTSREKVFTIRKCLQNRRCLDIPSVSASNVNFAYRLSSVEFNSRSSTMLCIRQRIFEWLSACPQTIDDSRKLRIQEKLHQDFEETVFSIFEFHNSCAYQKAC